MCNITKESDAVRFLKEHQPMPNLFDDKLEDDLLLKWITSLNLLSDYPSSEYVPLILGSYGGGCIPDGIDDIFYMYDPAVLFPYFITGLKSNNTDTREFTIFNLNNVLEDLIFGRKISVCDIYSSYIHDIIDSLLLFLVDGTPNVKEYAIDILAILEKYDKFDSNKHGDYIRNCYLKESHRIPKEAYEDEVLDAIKDLVPNRKRKR